MVVKLIENNEEIIKVHDLIDEAKESLDIDKAGAIFTFEGIVRGEEENMKLKKLILSTPDTKKTQKELLEIAESVKIKFGVFDVSIVHYVGEFYTGDSLFLVCVLGNHRGETLDALQDVIERVKFGLDFKKEEISDTDTKIIMSGG